MESKSMAIPDISHVIIQLKGLNSSEQWLISFAELLLEENLSTASVFHAYIQFQREFTFSLFVWSIHLISFCVFEIYISLLIW